MSDYPYWTLNGPHYYYPRPIPLVGVDPNDAPILRVCFNEDWLPYVLGACKGLVDKAVWQGTEAEAVTESQRAKLLLEQLANSVPGCYDEAPEGSWFCEYDFTDSENGFDIELIDSQPTGEYVTGVGFRATIVDYGTPPSTRYRRVLQLHKDFSSSRYVYAITVFDNYLVTDAPGGQDGRLQRTQLQDALDNIIVEHYARPADDDLNMEYGFMWDGMKPVNRLWGQYYAGWDSSDAGGLVSTSFVLTTMYLYGYGDQPTC
ncbi:MAG: hypothetical protein LUO93_07675 [Methanomicrobiales archaeon]|nr:hypothetical protein [Methanomicrobiales archaeon]